MSLRTTQRRMWVCLLVTLFVAGGPRLAPARSPRAEKSDAIARDLEKLARALEENNTSARYQQLAAFAKQHAKEVFGARAALALGVHDFNAQKYRDADRWLDAALRDKLLRDYSLYWSAQLERATGGNAKALALFEQHRENYPESVMAQQSVQAVAELALAASDAPRALAALDGYSKTSSNAGLLLLRGLARESADQKQGAAADFISIYYQQPLSDEAVAAGKRIDFLLRALGEQFPSVPQTQKLARAAAIFSAGQWKAARAEYEKLLPELSGAAHERAELRIAQCRVQSNGPIAILADLKFNDEETEAERLYQLSQAFRSLNNEAEMLTAIEAVAKGYPQSPWAEEALFAGGNYYRVNLDRVRAAEYYRRAVEAFPNGKNNLVAQWRVAWSNYLDRRPQASTQMEDHLRRFPGSQYSANALYWLGRSAERGGNAPQARTFYSKLVERFPQTYFGLRGVERLRAIGSGPSALADVVNLIPAPPRPPNLDEPVPAAAAERWERGKALRMIAFDASAELEFRAAHALTGSPRMLFEAAKSAFDAGRYMPAVTAARQAYPQLEARRWEDVPLEVWRVVFPFAYADSIMKYAKKNSLDPMIVAGLIRQETIFQRDAVSRAGAVGLMQVLPSTGSKLARSQKVRYTRAKLFDPDYNLRLGSVYFRDLLQMMGSIEAALASYNAGEHRVVLWKAENTYDEPAEFVESMPFTETREYVQVVLRNAEMYRRLYAAKNGSQR